MNATAADSDCIDTSVFELFKIGPGPSSSHTIAPMCAGADFLMLLQKLPEETLAKGALLRVRLFGSLSATGLGHGTDRAVLGGLLGQYPETCPADFLDHVLRDNAVHELRVRDKTFSLTRESVVFDKVDHDGPFSNTLSIALLPENEGDPLLEREYYSVGGGFLQWKGYEPPKRGEPRHRYSSMEQVKERLVCQGVRLHKLVLDNETAITGDPADVIYDKLRHILRTMENSVEMGIKTRGLLPGTIGLRRKAPDLHAHYTRNPSAPESILTALSAWAVAVGEENASGHCVVTAPTCGSSGVMPSVLYAMRHIFKLPEHCILEGLLAAAAIGFLCRHNASVAGAEVGCQGEIGVASAMAAAMLAYANGFSFQIVEHAAESALEHHLGMTCDPVGGYVQIPCIERNAMGAVKAFTAYQIAAAVIPVMHVVSLDQAIQAMAATGRDMDYRYKETSLGGLAVSMVNC